MGSVFKAASIRSLHDLGKVIFDMRAKIDLSRYHGGKSHLFLAEFWPEQWCMTQFNNQRLPSNEMLYVQRTEGMQLAAMQRVASAFVKDRQSLSSRREHHENDPMMSIVNSHLPTVLSASLPASVNPCSWLGKERTKLEQPFYVWDVQAARTVETSKIKDFEYICISHTWGRFRLDKKVADVPGVPWRVPRNEKFRVEVLPVELAKVFNKGYIWIDLFCIPQNRSEIALKEIARQAVIFQNAAFVIGWLNEVFITCIYPFNGAVAAAFRQRTYKSSGGYHVGYRCDRMVR